MKTQKTLIGIQDAYIATVNAGRSRWQHRKNGGHFGRIRGGAWRQAALQLKGLGFSDSQITAAMRDADDVAKLQFAAEEE